MSPSLVRSWRASSHDEVVNNSPSQPGGQVQTVDSPNVVTANAGHTHKPVVTARAGHKGKKGESTMKIYRLKTPIIASEVAVNIGLDVAADDIALCALGPGLEVLAREKIAHTEAAVKGLLAQLPGCTVTVAYEAGPTGYRLLRWLRSNGCHQAFMVAPSRIPVANGDRVKTDKRDALKLATLLATGQLHDLSVHDLTDEQYADRQLMRSREQMARKKTAICLQIKSLLLLHQIQLPPGIKPTWNKRMLTWLSCVETGHVALNQALREQLVWLDDATRAIKRMDRLCVELSRQPRYAANLKLLRSIPGFGLLTGMVFLTELPDLVGRFEAGESLVRYLGLVPVEHSTGKSQGRRGHLTHDGNVLVRTALVEASWRVISRDDVLRRRYEELKKRCGGKKAIVAIARHMAMTVYAMFRDNKPYRRSKEEVLQAA